MQYYLFKMKNILKTYNLFTSLQESHNKIISFRDECSHQRLSNGLKDLGFITLVGFAAYGFASFFDGLRNNSLIYTFE